MLITQERILEILKEAGVLLEGHFLLTSGRHSNKYLQCAKVFRNTKYSEEVSRGLHCENFFAERDQDGKMCLRRGFEVQPGQKVLLVEDVVTTGGSVREVLELVKAAGGDVVGIGSIVDRTGGKIDFGVPFKAVISMEVESYEPSECPLCQEGKIPVIKPGSRKIK